MVQNSDRRLSIPFITVEPSLRLPNGSAGSGQDFVNEACVCGQHLYHLQPHPLNERREEVENTTDNSIPFTPSFLTRRCIYRIE